MPPSSSNPAVLLAWVLAAMIGVPGFVLIVKGIFFVANASNDLQTVVRYVESRRSADQITDTTLTLMENDITAVQEHLHIPTHNWPDRRVGSPDRRASA